MCFVNMQSYRRAIVYLSKPSTCMIKPNHSPVSYFVTETSDKTDTVEESSRNDREIESKIELGGFAKSFARFAEQTSEEPEKTSSFAHLLRHSKLVDLGDPEGKVVTGNIFHVVGDDLYIDFGWKFHCVCPRPTRNTCDYVRGALVRIRIKDLELSTKFLGATKDLTILEADCTLTSLVDTPMKNITTA